MNNTDLSSIIPEEVSNKIFSYLSNPFIEPDDFEEGKYYLVSTVGQTISITRIFQVTEIIANTSGRLTARGSFLCLETGGLKVNIKNAFVDSQIRKEVPLELYRDIVEFFMGRLAQSATECDGEELCLSQELQSGHVIGTNSK